MSGRRGMILVAGAILVLVVASASVSARVRDGAGWTLARAAHVVDATLDRVGDVLVRMFGDEDAQVRSARQEAQGNEFSWSGRIQAGDEVEIKGINGNVLALPASGSRVEVVAIKSARRSDPAEVRVEVVEHDGGVTVCAVYPTPEGERENVCAPGSDGRMNVRRNDVEVNFEVRVPVGVRFVGRSVNGDVNATDLQSDVRVATVNGDVQVSTTGFAEAKTVNGSIHASVGSTAFRDGVEFETVNGSIELDLPDDIDAELDAKWVNGGLETEIPFLLQGQVARRHAQGTLGDGGPRLALSTVNGSIRIY